MGFSKFIGFLPDFHLRKRLKTTQHFFIKSLLKILLFRNKKSAKKIGDDGDRNNGEIDAKRFQCLQFVFRPIQIVDESVSDSEKVR